MPLYAAHADGMFDDAGLDVELLGAVPHEDRIERLRSDQADLALIDVAGFVDAVAADPDLRARCVFVVTQHLPEAAFFVTDPDTDDPGISRPADLVDARYGGQPGGRHTVTHQALLRRLGADPVPAPVEMSYREMFSALPAGEIDVLPDFGALHTRVRQAVPVDREIGLLRYRDCGVDAYGVGLVASGRTLADDRERLAAFLDVAAGSLRAMRDDPLRSIRTAGELLDVDEEQAMAEWQHEQREAIFDALPRDRPIGSAEAGRWRATAAWRSEVTGADPPAPGRLFEPVGSR